MMEIRECVRGSKEYPAKMMAEKRMPEKLYYAGEIGICNDKVAAVIGKRDIGEDVLAVAKDYGSRLARAGYVIVNGLAIGCDTAAIRGALDAGGKVIAVLPCGLDEVYPKSNKELAEEIVTRGGCLLSEYPAGSAPEKYMFVQRDRLQAVLADKVLVVAADADGGTMKTVDYALKYGRDVGCDMVVMIEGAWPEGNEFLIESRRARGIADMEGLLAFMREPVYRQISLFDKI